MAVTRLIPLHINKGKTIAQCLTERLEYGKNGRKTEDGKYISSYECDPRTACKTTVSSYYRKKAGEGCDRLSDQTVFQAGRDLA